MKVVVSFVKIRGSLRTLFFNKSTSVNSGNLRVKLKNKFSTTLQMELWEYVDNDGYWRGRPCKEDAEKFKPESWTTLYHLSKGENVCFTSQTDLVQDVIRDSEKSATCRSIDVYTKVSINGVDDDETVKFGLQIGGANIMNPATAKSFNKFLHSVKGLPIGHMVFHDVKFLFSSLEHMENFSVHGYRVPSRVFQSSYKLYYDGVIYECRGGMFHAI
jgi:hypothetical protein